MLKFTQAINVAVAGVLLVPAVTLQGDTAQTLRESLERTLAALETLAGIERHLQAGAPEAVAQALEHSEPPLVLGADDPAARDRLLESLRVDVGLLEAALERAQHGSAPSGASEPDPVSAAGPTTGLDDGLRELLAGQGREARALFVPPAPAERAEHKLALEGEGFTADPLRLAQAYYRKGQFGEAVAVLEKHGDGAEALYWKARSLEKLGEHEAAVRAYTAVSQAPDAGALASRALEDIEFLEWSLEFRRESAKVGP
jgi:hypothetical protein